MSDPRDHDQDLVDGHIRLAAEIEMGRKLPGSGRPSKRAKTGDADDEEYSEIGRFDYSAVGDLATGITCFLASADFKREKTATREAIELLLPHLKEALLPTTAATAEEQKKDQLISILKVSARGLVALKLHPSPSGAISTAKAAEAAVLAIYADAEHPPESRSRRSGSIKNLKSLQRIIPIASTCLLEVDALKECAARIAPLVIDLLATASKPTFAIAFHNRHNTTSTKDSKAEDRMQIISAVAQGLADEVKRKHPSMVELSVDLNNPLVVVVVEVLPVMGKQYAGIGVLPQELCTMKPKIGVKSLQRQIQVVKSSR